MLDAFELALKYFAFDVYFAYVRAFTAPLKKSTDQPYGFMFPGFINV